MSVVWLRERFQGRDASDSDAARHEYTRTFHALTDLADTAISDVLGSLLLPQVGAFYTDGVNVDIFSRCVRRTARQDDENPFHVFVEVQYSNTNVDPDLGVANPLDRRTRINLHFNKYSKPITVDTAGAEVVNSAGDYFDPPIEIDEARPVLTFTRNEDTFNIQTWLLYNNAVNSDNWFGLLPGQAKLTITANEAFEGEQLYWQVTYVAELRYETWLVSVLDQGYRELTQKGNDAQAKLYKILDPTGEPVQSPALLDGAGKVLAEGEDPVYLDFIAYQSLPFNDLITP